jgi:transcriptional regulator with XRE-family HTH domain
MTKISERVKIIVDNESVTIAKFSQNLGYERSQTIHDIVNGKSNPSYDFFYKFVKSEYSATYDLYWLITGEGSMYRTPGVMNEAPPPDRDEVVRLLREKVADQQRIIDLLDEKLEAVMAGGNTDTEIVSAAG